MKPVQGLMTFGDRFGTNSPEVVLARNVFKQAIHSRFDLVGELLAASARIIVQVWLWNSVASLAVPLEGKTIDRSLIVLYAVVAALLRSAFVTSVSEKMADRVQDGSIVLEF